MANALTGKLQWYIGISCKNWHNYLTLKEEKNRVDDAQSI